MLAAQAAAQHQDDNLGDMHSTPSHPPASKSIPRPYHTHVHACTHVLYITACHGTAATHDLLLLAQDLNGVLELGALSSKALDLITQATRLLLLCWFICLFDDQDRTGQRGREVQQSSFTYLFT